MQVQILDTKSHATYCNMSNPILTIGQGAGDEECDVDKAAEQTKATKRRHCCRYTDCHHVTADTSCRKSDNYDLICAEG